MKFRLFIQLVVCAWCMQAVSAHAAAVRENDDGRVVYSAGWADNNLSQGYHGGDQHYSSTSQATAEFSFTGTSIKWIGPKNVDCGISQVFLDNQLVASVDMYASSWLKQQVLFSRGSLENRTHTIRIVVTASKNPASIGYYSSIDAFEWDAAAGYNELNDGGLSYSGTWNVVVSPGGVANDLRTTTAAGATAQYSFTGRAIRWLGTKGNDQGIADLYVDGTRVASVDLYAPTNLVRQVLFAETNLVYGAHTLKIVATGQRNASSSGVRVTVDAVDADRTTIRVDDS